MQYKAGEYDVIVVGAGHAGCEAALAAARMGMKTLVLTIHIEAIANMPCNPSIGGPAKGHVVREIDALGGEMAKCIDRTNIQIRKLNTGKGPAVHALRAQADRHLYAANMRKTLESAPNIVLRQGMVDRLIIDNQQVNGVELNTGAQYYAKSVILTTGTYLRGRIIIGKVDFASGPNGMMAAQLLSSSLQENGVELARFKTGTPARVHRDSIDFSKMVEQPGDEGELRFSHYGNFIERPRMSCWLTYTTEQTKKIIIDNLDRSPMYSGAIAGTGTRYCPSIEDKIVRFQDKPIHQIFLEPEGIDTVEYYVQGFSTSFPEDLQIKMLRSIVGLENVHMIRPGYAIEYDVVLPHQLKASLEVKVIKGLFTAGQLNGTSGYEEAAGQGLIAGINASLYIKKMEPLVLARDEAYIGVLIDDLVTKGVMDPYRLLTSRAEYRLLLRNDNADLRLTEIGFQKGSVDKQQYQVFVEKKNNIEAELKALRETRLKPDALTQQKLADIQTTSLSTVTTLADLLKRPEIHWHQVNSLKATIAQEHNLSAEEIEQVEIQIKYEGYIKKQLEQVERHRKLEKRIIPENIDYAVIKGIALEAKEKLTKIRPETIGQASRISGVNPADVSILLVYIEQFNKTYNNNH